MSKFFLLAHTYVYYTSYLLPDEIILHHTYPTYVLIILSVLSITRLNSDSTFAISLIIFLSDVKVIHVDLTFPS